MSYHNSYYNLNSYFATSTAGEDEFPFLNQSPSVDPSNGQAYDVLTDHCGMVPQRGPTVGLPASLLGTTGSNSVAGATPYGKGFDGLAESSYPNPCWPMHDGAWSAYCISTPSSGTEHPPIMNSPLHSWGENQSGPLTSTFNQNVPTSNQSMSGPTRTGQTSTRRFKPYGTSRARETEHRNAEADSPTTTLPQVPYVGLPTPQPTGGLTPETTADAENEQSTTKEQVVPVSNFYHSHIPHVTDWSFGIRRSPSAQGFKTAKRVLRPGRKREQDDFETLCRLVRNWRRKGTSTRNQVLTHVLAYIKTVRQEVYLFSRLKTGNLQPCPDDSAPRSRNEWKRGVTERTLMAQLSQFYHRRPQDKFWSRPFLLKEVLMDLEVRYPLIGPPNGSGPQVSTSAVAL